MGELKLMSFDAFLAHVSKVMEKETGVQLGIKQQPMLRSRLQRRAIELGLLGTDAYVEYFFENEAAERKALVSIVTTHHTFFFREAQHFEYIEQILLQELIPEVRSREDKTLRIWSAACSRGQEVYTLAMVLNLSLQRLAPDLKFEILGTDIDEESIAIARNGVFYKTELQSVPLRFMGDHWSRGSGEIVDFVKARASLRQQCTFAKLNLFSPYQDYPKQKFDLIFCRNVFIYFTPPQITEIMKNFSRSLSPGGHIFLGVSETIGGLNLNLESVGPSIYRAPLSNKKKSSHAKAPPSASGTASEAVSPVAPFRMKRPLRIFAIDDSPTIHTLLKQILAKDADFELVGSAFNGKEAMQKMPAANPDVVTLDIHMPEMTGIEYLRRNMNAQHPPVVMISSVSREDGDLAYQALDLGAIDYVEKPALANLEERGDEIRLKLKSAYTARHLHEKLPLAMDKSFAHSFVVKTPDSSAFLVVGNASQRQIWERMIREWPSNSAPVYFIVEGIGSGLAGLAKKMNKAGKAISVWAPGIKPLRAGEICVCDFSSSYAEVFKNCGYSKLAVAAFHGVSKNACEKMLQQGKASLFVEDLGSEHFPHPLKEAANDSVPSTSFVYLAIKALAED